MQSSPYATSFPISTRTVNPKNRLEEPLAASRHRPTGYAGRGRRSALPFALCKAARTLADFLPAAAAYRRSIGQEFAARPAGPLRLPRGSSIIPARMLIRGDKEVRPGGSSCGRPSWPARVDPYSSALIYAQAAAPFRPSRPGRFLLGRRCPYDGVSPRFMPLRRPRRPLPEAASRQSPDRPAKDG